MLKPEETAAGFVAQAGAAAEVALGAEALAELRADAKALGLFGLLGSLAIEGAPDPDPAVRGELVQVLERDLRDALESGAGQPLGELMERFVAEKGEQGPELLGRLVARVLYELYDLGAHGFIQDDALAAAEAMAWGGPGQDARECVRRITRLSRHALRNALGHLDSQLDLVHALGNPDFPILYRETDRRLDGFAPRVFAERLPSLIRVLVREEKRFRFAVVLWARLRGLVIGKGPLVAATERIDPKAPLDLLRQLEQAKLGRGALRLADEAFPQARLIEAALRGRPVSY